MLADCESNNSISFVVCGGYGTKGKMSRNLIFTTSISGDPSNVVPLTWQGNPEQLLEND